jgi:hypothetical protein
VNEFVEECRREWRQLGVPDPIANEMAADLMADLDEAEAEGASAEDVLGNSAFDPRRFAAAWANARGVTGPGTSTPTSRWRTPVAMALTALLSLMVAGAGLAVLVSFRGRAFAVAARRIVAAPGGIRVFHLHPGPPFIGGPLAPVIGQTDAGVHPLALVVLLAGIVGLGLLAWRFWAPWFASRRRQRIG